MSHKNIEKRLKSCIDSWKRINAGETVLNWIEEGVPIPFNDRPGHRYIPNPKFNKVHYEFIQKEIGRLLSIGAIEICQMKPRFISPLNVVPKKNGSYRLITNLKCLNESVARKSYRNEDIRTTLDLVEKDDMMSSIDLKDCFLHISVRKQDRVPRYYVCRSVLPMVRLTIQIKHFSLLLY